MSCSTYYAGKTWIHRLDPRPRILLCSVLVFFAMLSWSPGLLTLLFGLSLAAAGFARLPVRALGKRLLRLNLFMLVLCVVFPLTIPGELFLSWGPLSFSKAGLFKAVLITLKANAIVLFFSAWIGTIDLFSLGHALHHLHVPGKLTHIFLFTVRYLDVLHHEYQGLVRAMKVRGFRPRASLHTYRSYGHLVGMLLVRSLERSERVLAAMKCRGFTGTFHPYHHFHFHRRDYLFCGAGVLCTVLLGVLHAAWQVTS